MTRTTLAFALTAAAALAGCNKGAPADTAADQANNAAAAVPIELPPSILASKIYRCKDNSVVYIDWLSDNKSANVRGDKNGTPTHVVGPEAGQAMVADGYSLTGSATAATSLQRHEPAKLAATRTPALGVEARMFALASARPPAKRAPYVPHPRPSKWSPPRPQKWEYRVC